MGSTPRRWPLVIALALVGCVSITVAMFSRTGPVEREIRLVARDMAYYVDGQGAPNPTIRVRRGEQVRLILVNQDPGMTHDIAIGAWQVRTSRLDHGQQASVTFQIPSQAGETAYACTPHSGMMQGTIRVE